MPTSFSTNLALALPATGELSGTWGTTVNSNITNMLDEALGYQAFTATGGSDTLTIPDGTTGVARSIYIQLNGTGGGTVNVPTAKTKMYFVFNNTSSAITFKVTSQTGVSIPAAAKIALVSNGTDIITAENYLTALTLGAALPATSGGTGLTASGSLGNVLTSNGTTWASSAPAAGGITYTVTKTANYTAVANDGVLTNTTAGAFTVTLPASPSNGAQVIVADAGGTWGTNNLTVGRNGNNIADVAQDLVCDISGVSVQFVYNSSGTASWEVFAQVGGNGGSVVTLTDTQTLTNKTIAYGSNTLTDVVGVTATQTLTNKTLTSPTLTTPTLGTPASGNLTSCTADGTNKVGYQNIPLSGIKTASYTLVAGDVGKFVELGTSGTIVVPASVFAAGDAISIFNNTAASISCTCSAVTTVYKGGTDADISTFSVTTRGVATILFITATVAVVTGNLA